jgi:DNA-binding transcriptional LysR family regulator
LAVPRSTPTKRRPSGHLPPELRVGDLTTFLTVHRCASVTGAARVLGTSPSQVSKAIARLERQLQMVLLSRSTHGVRLTDAALRVLPRLESAVAQLQQIAAADPEHVRTLTLAGSSWLVALMLPSVAEALPALRFCGLELPPAMLRAHVAENFFDLSLIVGRANLPPTWHRTAIGDVRLGLLARPRLADQLGAGPVEVKRLLPVPFITPVYSVNGRFVEADDDCPLSFSERRLGHKVQTIRVALSLATRIDQLVFGPIIAAQEELADGRLREVAVKGWRSSEPLMLSCNPEKVRSQEHAAIVESLQRTLRQLG